MKLSLTTIGIIFAIVAYFSFSLLDTIQKTAVIYHSIFQILFLKYFFTLFYQLLSHIEKKIITFIKQIIQNFKLAGVFYQLLNQVALFYHLDICH